MNVFDFDKTIYHGDSSFDFWKYCLCHYPKTWLYLPKQLFWSILFLIRICPKTKFKEKFFSYFKAIKDIDQVMMHFWDKNECKIKQWYIDIHKSDDIIISASPEFQIQAIAKRLAVTEVIGSPVDKRTGRYSGVNCSGEEKVVRFYRKYGKQRIDNFYSDSYSDTPLAEIADKAFLVKNNKIDLWKVPKSKCNE